VDKQLVILKLLSENQEKQAKLLKEAIEIIKAMIKIIQEK